MALLKEIAAGLNEEEIQEYRYNVVLRTKVGGFKLYLETNVNAVSKNDAIQTVSRILEKSREDFLGVMKEKWMVKTITPIKPTSKMQHQQRMINKM